ncbi:uncharacterized protein BT62DRAFT_1076287 [Guyanagaster necrorhizus]|uniref:Uncharacterized protein n=1 Tax=Guyanagaster necrorhizus TaxID=856835 RepID=A0A9P7VSK3_9AGAR|nr:uncharacterized protein BT62DRAFT_1076287 [Guyanagaster necrorhizus MCA 3950]KAG7445868.1 hypothetical protein BT62DRAFT_1076287 [Guyanagaster necrorhizus MCA 3950]
MSTARVRREEDVRHAEDLQTEAGIRVAARATAIGLGLSIIAHYAWPWYRRQPMSFKGFLVTTSGVFGLVFGAEHALLEYEAERRVQENAVRRQARLELTRRGIVPTETEINKWRLAKEDTGE